METKSFQPGSVGMPRCLVLGSRAGVRDLLQVLGFSFTRIDVVEAFEDIDGLPGIKQPDLLVATDSVSGGLTPPQLEAAKSKLKPGATICLTHCADDRTEVRLRSVGLVFLGTCETFLERAGTILKGFSEVRADVLAEMPVAPLPPAGDRPLLARAMEGRLRPSARAGRGVAASLAWRTAAACAGTGMRLIEAAAGLAVSLCLTLPAYLWLLARYLLKGTPVVSRRTIDGCGRPMAVSVFNLAGSLRNLPLFLHLMTGRLALVGIPITDWEARPVTPMQGYIRQVRPGICSLWSIRRASRIAHEGQENIEWEYVFKKGVLYDLLLLLRGIPSLVYGAGSHPLPDVLRLLDLDIANLSMTEAMERLALAASGDRPCSVFFVNPDCINKMATDRDYFHILTHADYVFPDGIGLTLAGKLLKTPLKENINGTDMLPFLCRMAASRGHSIFLLGGRPGVAARAAQRLVEQYQVTIAGTAHGYFDHDKDSPQVIDQINRSGATILLTGMGAPVQEKWITHHRAVLSPKILMGVGGLFDFYSGSIKRAPVWMRETGLEWVYRILQEPGRMWRRYVIGNPLFLYRVVKWRYLVPR